MRNLWIVNQYAQEPSCSGGTRHYSLARHLDRHAWRSVIIASSFAHNVGYQRLQHKERKRFESCHGVHFLWLKLPFESCVSKWRRLLNMISFGLILLKPRVTRHLPKPDLVIGSTVHPFGALAACLLARRHCVPFVFEVRDLWPSTLVAMGAINSGGIVERVLAFLERWLARQASCIVVLMPGGLDYYSKLGVDRDRLLWLPNGSELDHAVPKPHRVYPRPFQLLYCGSHGQANSLDTILEAMALLRQRGIESDQLVLRLIGNGPYKSTLQQRAIHLNLSSVFFQDPVSKNDLLPLISEADGFVVAMQHLPELYCYGISFNKLFDYFLASRPIVSASCAAHDPVEAAEAGIVVPAGDPTALADAIDRLRKLPYQERQRLGANGRAYLEAHHTYPLLAQRLAAELDLLVQPR